MKWTNINRRQPKNGQTVSTRVAGNEGYHGATIWHKKSKTFRTYQRLSNRYVITIWDADEWKTNETKQKAEVVR